MNIPDDVMEAARSVAMQRLFSDFTEDRGNELMCHIARALLSERESATKAERERCAQVALGCDTMGVNYPDDALMKIGRVARAKCFAIAAAIRKGDGE